MDNPQGLYKLTWTTVDAHTSDAHKMDVRVDHDATRTKLTYKTQTLIVEAVDGQSSKYIVDTELPNRGMFPIDWLDIEKPYTLKNHYPHCREDSIVIIHSIIPYAPSRKHARDDGKA